jgi:hypothetical protein
VLEAEIPSKPIEPVKKQHQSKKQIRSETSNADVNNNNTKISSPNRNHIKAASHSPATSTTPSAPPHNNPHRQQQHQLDGRSETTTESESFKLKERKIVVRLHHNREIALNILAINEYQYIHPSQFIQMTGMQEWTLDAALKKATDNPNEFEPFSRSFELSEKTEILFDWLQARLNMDISELTKVELIRYDKLNILLDNLLQKDHAAEFKNKLIRAKNVRPDSPTPSFSYDYEM